MVYRICHAPHSRWRYFLRRFVVLLAWMLVFCLLCMLLFSVIRWQVWAFVALPLLMLGAAFASWLILRRWNRVDWFTPTPRAVFLTMVPEGLLIESPARGYTVYLPWQGLSWRCSGHVLRFFYHGMLRSMVSFYGLPRERRLAVLESLRAHAGMQEAPAVLLPPPAALQPEERLFYSNNAQQRREYVRYAARLDTVRCAVVMVLVAYLSVALGWELTRSQRWEILLFFSVGLIYFCRHLCRPGRSFLSHLPGGIRLRFASSEFCEEMEQGAWGRYRLPAPAEGALVRLPHSWLLLRERGLPLVLADAEGELPPPPLAVYPLTSAPRNRLRTLITLSLLLGGVLTGFLCAQLVGGDAALRKLMKNPTPEARRAFVEERYAHGALLDTPLVYRARTGGEEPTPIVCIRFTDSEPAPENTDGGDHFAYIHRVALFRSGELLAEDSEPAPWCPCAECSEERLQWLLESAPEPPENR